MRIPVVPSKGISGNEAGEDIIATDHATRPRNKERQRDRKDEEALPIHKFLLFRIMKQFFGEPSHGSSVNHAQDDRISPGLAKPQADAVATVLKTIPAIVFH